MAQASDTRNAAADATVTGTAATRTSFAAGRYRVDRVLGIGGQKVVYLVEDTALGRRCALSLLSKAPLDPGEDERLQREAQAMARLGAHPNLVTVYDIGSDVGRPFIVCEYVPGGDLGAEIAAGRIPIDRALSVAGGILSALRFVHAHGLVHRDVKPGNVWIAADGAAKLGDFGLALALDRSRLTAEGTMLGTPAYMAPEQVRGDAADARADLYAAGCVLYEMLAGRLPFVGEPMAILYQHLHTDPAPPSRANPSVPKAVDRFVLSLLAKEPGRRPASAEQALADLERARAAPAPVEAATAAHDPRVGHLPFVGRGAELDALRAALENALSGTPSVRALAGEPGIGKTRLLQELGLHARLRGARVLVGRCTDSEGAPPYLPFVEALGADLAARKPDDLRRHVGEGAAALVEILPDLRDRLGEVPVRGRGTPEGDRYEVFQAVASTLRSLAAESGLLLAIEDIHWSDEPSLLLLLHLARRLEESKILLVVTYRDVEVGRGHRLAQVLADLRRERLYERVSLHGLAMDDVRALVASADPAGGRIAGDLARSLHGRTEGNPFFVAEVLKDLAEGQTHASQAIPEGVREVVGHRLTRLSAACNAMLTTASAMPGGAPWDVLRALVDEPEDRLLDLLDEALAAQVLRERSGASATYEFTHALIRETLYAEISTPRRARLHRRIGEAMERAFAGRLDAHLPDLAFHFHEAAGDPTKAIEYAGRAGDASMASYAFEDAARHFARALDLGIGALSDEARADLEGRRGRALAASGEHAAARKAFEAAVAGTPAPQIEKRAALLLDLCEACYWSFDIPAIGAHTKVVHEYAVRLGRTELAAAAHAWDALVRASDGDLEEAFSDLVRVGEKAPGLYTRALPAGSVILYWLGRIPEAVARSRALLEAATAAHDPSGMLFTMQCLASSLAAAGRYAESRARFAEARALGTRYGNKALLARAISLSAGASLDLGDLKATIEIAEEAREMAASVGFRPTQVSTAIDLLFCHARGGEPDRALQMVPAVREAASKASGFHGWAWRLRLATALAEIDLARGDRDAAVASASEAIALCRRYKRAKYEILALVARAAARGRSAESEADLREAFAIARRTGDRTLVVRAGSPLAVLAGDADAGEAARAAASEIVAALPDDESRTRFRRTEVVRALGAA